MSVERGIEYLRPRFLPDRDAVREWGGKGAPIARMIRKGFAVPPTAALGLSEVHRWLESLPEYAPAIEAWRRWDAQAPERLAALEHAILKSPMPEHWELSAATLRRLLCGDTDEALGAEGEAPWPQWPMILRSSMSAEDGAAGSLAGCFESVVVRDTGAAGLWRGLTQVVASAFRLSSAERLLVTGVDPRRFRPGVVIQPYLVAELAGVCFSRDPSNPWDRDGTVEWVRGAGEALVQGTGPSSLRRRSEGGVGSGLEPFWDALWKRAEDAEKIVGGPVDLEWVWDGSQLWFVQARPIATEEARLAARAPGRHWSRGLTLERFPEPLTPMGWSVLQDAFAVNLRTLDRRFGVVAKHPEDMAVSVRGTVYSDPKFFSFPSGVRIRWGKHLNPFSSAPWKALAAVLRSVGRALTGRGGSVSRALFKMELVQALLGREARAIERGWDRHRDGSLARLREFKPTLAALTGAEPTEAAVLERMSALTEISLEFMEPDLAVYLIKDALNKALLGLCRALGWDEAAFADLFRSFEGNRTLEMNAEWKECVQALRGDPERAEFVARLERRATSPEAVLGEPARAAWMGFLERNGHSTTSWDVATPCWSDEPSQLAPLLRAALGSQGEAARQVKPSELRGERRAQLFAALGAMISRKAVGRVEAAMERLESFMRIDEEHHFLSGLLMAPSRTLILAGGRCLVRQGLLERGEDAFFVTFEELKVRLEDPGQGMSLRCVSTRRRSELERAKKATPPFELPTAPSATDTGGAMVPELGERAWQGAPMSPGVVTGRAVVAEHLDQVRGIESGAILVTTSPNPALTPLYPLLGGLVSATGSSLSHGFVSAREYALPAVAGIARVTEKIPPGALVRVDGTRGRVEVLA